MLYQVLADLVLVGHAAFVAFAIFGALLALRWRPILWLHIPALFWGAFVEFSGWVCPLTPLENSLRNAAGRSGYAGDFIEHYIDSLLYSSTLSRNDQMILGVALLVVNLVIYSFVLFRPGRSRGLPNKPLQPTRRTAPRG